MGKLGPTVTTVANLGCIRMVELEYPVSMQCPIYSQRRENRDKNQWTRHTIALDNRSAPYLITNMKEREREAIAFFQAVRYILIDKFRLSKNWFDTHPIL